MDYSSEILELCKLCKTVDLYISTQAYKNEQTDPEDPDSITEQELLINCYVIILQELRLLGIEVHVEWEDALSNFYDAKAYAYLLSMMDKDKLISNISNQYENKDRFTAIFENSEDSESDLLLAFLEVYFYYIPFETHRDRILSITDTLYSTNDFSTYMKNVLSLVSPRSTINLTNINQITSYINKIIAGRKSFESAINTLIEHTVYDENINLTMTNYLRDAINSYDEEKIAGTDLSRYCWAVMSDDNDLSDSEKVYKKNILFEHTSHQTHHIEYYHVNHFYPTIEQIAELVCHHVEPDSTYLDFKHDVEEMIKQDKDNEDFHAFDNDTLAIVNHYANVLIQYHYNEHIEKEEV